MDPLNLDKTATKPAHGDDGHHAHSSEVFSPQVRKQVPPPLISVQVQGAEQSSSLLTGQSSMAVAALASPPRAKSPVPELAHQQIPMSPVTPPRDVDAAHLHSNGGEYSGVRGRGQAGHKLRPLPESSRKSKSSSKWVDE